MRGIGLQILPLASEDGEHTLFSGQGLVRHARSAIKPSTPSIGSSCVLRPRQHSIGYMGDGSSHSSPSKHVIIILSGSVNGALSDADVCMSVCYQSRTREARRKTNKLIIAKIQASVETVNVDYRMQYYDVITNPRWLRQINWNLKIVM